MDDYLVSTCPDPLHCSGYYRGAMLYHHHRYALSVASHHNKGAGYKMYRVVMVKGHFVVVDRTWERNN